MKSHWLWWGAVVGLAVAVWWSHSPTPSEGASVQGAEYRAHWQNADPDDVLVDFVDDIDVAEVAALGRRLGIHFDLVSDQSLDERFYRAHVDPQVRDELLAQLSRLSIVEIAEPDAVYSLGPQNAVLAPGGHWAGFPDDPQFEFQWHLDQINMRSAWQLGDGDGVIVAVLDTGVAYEDHGEFHQVEDLRGVEFVKPYDFVNNDSHANDDHAHGTHVAGTIAQATHNGIGVAGVARAVKIMPLKVLSGSGSGSIGGIADAIRYAADEGAHVINMSLGGPFPSRALESAVKYAYDKGVVVVCAAGNDGRGRVGYPAAYPGAIAVAATQYDQTTTFYSNYGKHIDIAAPGGNVRVDQNGDGMPDGVLQNTIATMDPSQSDYFAFMGTSMASPHAAGVAALVVGEGITDPAHVERIMKESAQRPASYEQKRYGAGIIDAQAAIVAARSKSGSWQFLMGLLVACAAAFAGSRRVGVGAGYFAGATIGAGGLFFLPWLIPAVASVPGIEMLTRGLPSWGAGWMGPDFANALTMSALLPLALLAVGMGVRRFRKPLAGLCAGVAGHLLFHLATGVVDVRWMVADKLWLAANALICIALAHAALRHR